MPDAKKENVNIYRKIKRLVRNSLNWNERPLEEQLKINLCTIFLVFFLLYSIVVFFCTKFVYLKLFKETVDPDLDPILEDRLDYSTQAIATTFYMIDKLGIDVAIRLSGVYQSSTNFQPFPIKPDADGFGLYDQDQLSGDEKIYSAGVTCKDNTDAYAPLKQLKYIWQNSVLLGIGQDRKVNAERIIFMYEDNVCVYPAQSFDSFKYQEAQEWTSEPFYSDLTRSDNTDKYFIERHATDYFNESEDKFTTYYAPLIINESGINQTIGVVGFQLNQNNYEYLLPSPILEPPYSISFITVVNLQDGTLIWHLIDPGSDLTEKQYEDEIATKIEAYYMQESFPTERSVNLTNGDVYNFDYSYSPVINITHHENFDEKYNMIVICGQRESLKKLIRENMEAFVDYHLNAFQIIGGIMAVILFVIFFSFFLCQLRNKISKPIVNLTNNIKNPKEFAADKKDKKDKKRKNSVIEQDGFDQWDGDGGRKKGKKNKIQYVDEVKALENLFKTFFGDRSQSDQTTGLVEMTSYETSINPFYKESDHDPRETTALNESVSDFMENTNPEIEPINQQPKPNQFVDQIAPRLKPDWINEDDWISEEDEK